MNAFCNKDEYSKLCSALCIALTYTLPSESVARSFVFAAQLVCSETGQLVEAIMPHRGNDGEGG